MASILWISDSPSRLTGFGVLTRNICSRLAARGHELHLLAWWCDDEHISGPLTVLPCPVAPSCAVPVIVDALTKFKPDWVVTLADIPWISYMASQNVQDALSTTGTKWLHYYPVDATMPDGTLPSTWVDVLSRTDIAVAMSEFGRTVSARSGIDALVIPHGVNVSLFCPPEDKAVAKSKLGYAGKFVVLSDIRNHRRKLIPRILDVAAAFREAGDQIVFHLHTNLSIQEDLGSYTYDLPSDIGSMGLEEIVRVSSSDPPGFDDDQMADLYGAADVHLLLSWGEGFGFPTLQAAASGVVPIAPANSANVELVARHGIAITCDAVVADEFGLMRGFASREQAVHALRQLRDDRDLLEAKSRASRAFALQFDWDTIISRWTSVLLRYVDTGGAGRQTSGRVADVVPSETNYLKMRPTGHHDSILPVPRIGIPTRLRQPETDAAAFAQLVVFVDCRAADELSELGKLFPGIRISGLSSLVREPDLAGCLVSNGAVLVVCTDPLLLPGLDAACAIAATSFIGPSLIWPAIGGESLFHEARLALTDFAIAERRLLAARARMAEAGVE